MLPIRIGVIGARRRAQGIGEFVARDLALHGAAVTAIVGTQPDTVEAARQSLHERYGLNVRGYLSVAAMLAGEPLDAVAVCSPQQFHREHLEQALEHDLHALCEKPLVFEAGRDSAADALRLAGEFAHRRRLLMVNEPWPYTLPCFDRCWPGVRRPGQPPLDLAMLLCPSEQDAGMIPNALPHVLSLLLTLAPAGGEAQAVRVSRPDAHALQVQFEYVHQKGRTRVAARFSQRQRQPRPAGYAIDGHGVRRQVRMPDYRMYFEAKRCATAEEFWRFAEDGQGSPAANQVPLEDPLPLLIGDFLRRLSRGEDDGGRSTIAASAQLLAKVFQTGSAQLAAADRERASQGNNNQSERRS